MQNPIEFKVEWSPTWYRQRPEHCKGERGKSAVQGESRQDMSHDEQATANGFTSFAEV